VPVPTARQDGRIQRAKDLAPDFMSVREAPLVDAFSLIDPNLYCAYNLSHLNRKKKRQQPEILSKLAK
jgi:hypothetical protein